MLCFLWPVLIQSQGTSEDELEIRSAMIFNLTRFIEWPASKTEQTPEFVICTLGSDPLFVNLAIVLKGKQVGSKPVALRRLSSVNAATGCHVLYVGVSERRSLVSAMGELEHNNVLTMSEKSNNEDPIQTIGLPTIDEHVHIDVNLAAAQRSGLTMSSKLLRLATVTH